MKETELFVKTDTEQNTDTKVSFKLEINRLFHPFSHKCERFTMFSMHGEKLIPFVGEDTIQGLVLCLIDTVWGKE